MKFLFTMVVIIGLETVMRGQQQNTVVPHDSTELKVFILCQNCYQDFLKTQITWVNFVRDRFDAQVQIVISTLTTGSGGMQYQLSFIGFGPYSGMNDTLNYTSNAINTQDEVRRGLAHYVGLGLLRYVAHTPKAQSIVISSGSTSDEEEKGIGKNPQDDPWNAWVFNTSVNGELSGQRVSKSQTVRGNLNASRTTEKMKCSFNVNSSYNEQSFNYQGEKSVFILRSSSIQGLYVHSIASHWSAGVLSSLTHSDFSNFKINTNLSAAIEYDIFPYKAAQTKLITLTYAFGLNDFQFQDTTIFNRIRQFVPIHKLNIGAQFTQKWGSLQGGIYGSEFLNDLTIYRVGGWLNCDIRIFRGFSINGYISYDAIHDQINLRKESASGDQVLLAQRELSTSYSFYAWFGLNYRFGSIYNNVVNPRFSYSGF